MLPKSSGYDTIPMVVDRLSKYCHFIPLSYPYTVKSMAAHFCGEIVCCHGMPRFVLLDRDLLFLSAFRQELSKLSQTCLRMSTACHPQIDGQTEVVTIALRPIYGVLHMSNHVLGVSSYVGLNSHSTLVSMFLPILPPSKFKVVYGRDPLPFHPFIKGETHIVELADQLETRYHMLQLLRDDLKKDQNLMKMYADQHRREISFEVGDDVFLIQPFKQCSLFHKEHGKLSPQFLGPYHQDWISGL